MGKRIRNILFQELDEQGLSVKVQNLLAVKSINIMLDLVNKNDWELLKIKGLGSKTLIELEKLLSKHHMGFKNQKFIYLED